MDEFGFIVVTKQIQAFQRKLQLRTVFLQRAFDPRLLPGAVVSTRPTYICTTRYILITKRIKNTILKYQPYIASGVLVGIML